MPVATLGSQMRAVNKVPLYYNDWKVLKESSRLAELQRGVLQGAIVTQQSASCPHLAFCLARDDIELLVLLGVLRGSQVSLGLSWGTGQSEDSAVGGLAFCWVMGIKSACRGLWRNTKHGKGLTCHRWRGARAAAVPGMQRVLEIPTPALSSPQYLCVLLSSPAQQQLSSPLWVLGYLIH